jgi:hypothetical protein
MHISTSTKRATIGLYAGRNLKNVEAIQTNANQFEEGTANMTYQSGLLHIVHLEQFQGGQAQPYYDKDTIDRTSTTTTTKMNKRSRIKIRAHVV